MTTIFLSHSSKDKIIASEIKMWLEARNHSVFLDFDIEAGIKGGAEWEKSLYERLRICRVIIPLITLNWLESKWCFAEVVHARFTGKMIVPIKVEDCDASEVFPVIQQINLLSDTEGAYRRLELALKEVFPWNPNRPPYPGLPAFQEDDAAIFFGRAPEIVQVIETLESLRRSGRMAPRFALMLGASGSGKSSLVRAGLIPRLRPQGCWLSVAPFRPRENPINGLAESLAQAYESIGHSLNHGEIEQRLQVATRREPPDGDELLSITRDLAIKAQRIDATVLIVIDQAEELFVERNSKQADQFLHMLRAALERTDGRFMCLATMRSEFFESFQINPFLLDPTYPEPFKYVQIPLDPLPLDRFSQVILGPKELAGIVIDDDLVQQMLKDASNRDALPLLAYTLRRLWDSEARRRDGRFGLHEYEELGGLEGSIRTSVNEVISAQGLQPNQLEVLRDAFIPALVRVEADGTRGRSRAYREELPRSVDELLQRFVDARLLVTDRDREGRETVEVAHDALLRVWTQLDSWLAQDEDKLRLREGIHRAAEEWNSAECKPDLLLHRGEHLTDALALLHEPRFAFRPMSVEARYIAQCEAAQRAREQAEKEAREQRIRDAERIAETQKKVTMRTRIALIVVLILAFLAAGAGMRAQNNAKLAEKSQDIVLEAINQFTSDASNLIDENKFSEVFAIYSRAEDALAFGAINDANNLKLQFAYASIIKKLGDVFGMEGNYGEAIKRYEKAIGKLDQIIELHPENEKYKNFKAGVYRNIAFSQIYNRQPGKAVIAAERGLNLNPDSAEIKVMLAHAYLFDSQIDKAKSIYLENRDVKLGNQLTFREVVLRDFKYFTSNGLTHPDMANIEHLLNDQR